jgi:hypothetical protein
MKSSEKDLPSKLRDLGIKIYQSAKNSISSAKSSVENTILEENLKHRFNLENPYKFIVLSEPKKIGVINELSSRHAKRYDEDDLFVFYGKLENNEFQKGHIIRDISNNAEYSIKEILEVSVPVEYKHKSYDVIGTAVMCDAL